MLIKVLIFSCVFTQLNFVDCQLEEFVKWQILKYKNVPDSAFYNASVNIPFGVLHYKGKLLVSIPRRNAGVPATLNMVELKGNPPYINPLISPYPNYDIQSISESQTANTNKIISVYRVRADRCGNLWFVDTGTLERRVVQRPSLWAINLQNDQVKWRYELPPKVVANDGIGMVSVTLDDNDCSNIFAYIPDLVNHAIVVVDTKNGNSWRFTHNYFRANPFEADFNVDGFKFQWDDGIFSIALSNTKPDGYKTAFFHPMASHGEFTVSTKILKNEALATRLWHENDFKFIGHSSNRGIHFFDRKNRVLFANEAQKNGVSCWNPKDKESMKPSQVHMVAQNNQTMIYPVDLEIDDESTLWMVSNRLPRFLYGTYDYNLFNFNIFKGKTDDLLKGSGCV